MLMKLKWGFITSWSLIILLNKQELHGIIKIIFFQIVAISSCNHVGNRIMEELCYTAIFWWHEEINLWFTHVLS